MKHDDVVLLESLLSEIVDALTPALRSAELALINIKDYLVKFEALELLFLLSDCYAQ